MALALVKPWRTQPAGAAPAINWRSGLTKELVLLNYGFSDNDLVTGGDWVWTAGTNPVATQYGMGRRLTSASSQWGYYDTPFSFNQNNYASLSVCVPLTSTGAQMLAAIQDSTGANRSILGYGFVTSSFYCANQTSTGPNSSAYPLNVPQTAVYIRRNGSDIIYVSGRRFSGSLGTFGAATYNKASIGARLSGGTPGSYLNGVALFTAFWNRPLAEGEAYTLSVNPWQLFRGVETLSVPTYYPILSNLQATRGNTSAALRTNINY